ncbi:claudin-23-like [Hemibagrus wyckioides]|uniref:claudin-23-like n=1 Tax=Hemibagrus wyckioides TaxID=337641 RepID=UPI00266D47DA|nr:claudin-23-like [Hemibagrus wyckioides]
MKIPGIIIFGLVSASCGWILTLTSTVAPNWRTIHNLIGQPSELILHQGIWDICRSFTESRDVLCNHEDTEYFNNQIIEVARRMMVASLIVTLIGLSLLTIGTTCCTDRPKIKLAGFGGFLISSSGILAIIPIAWYNHILMDINSPSTDIRIGYCIILGYTGGHAEFLSGFVIFTWIYRCCGGRNREQSPDISLEPRHKTTELSISVTRSRASSVPSHIEKQDISVWRANKISLTM